MPASTTVVAYSRSHFDPDGDAALHRASSTAALAEAAYHAAVKSSSNVIYLDAQNRSEWPDLEGVTSLVGIESAFVDLVKRYKPKSSMLFAVNQEAKVSVEKWLGPIKAGKLPSTALLGSYDLHSRDPRAAALADQILIVGDNGTYGSYMQEKNPDSLHVVAYEYGDLDPARYEKAPVILFPASSIGVRKGVDLVDSVCRRLADRHISEFQVVVLGGPSNHYWRRKLSLWQELYSGTFRYLGWLNSSQNEYRQVMSSPICAVIPSREEGLVGTAVELLKAGVPVFATVECGLGPRSEGFVLADGREELWADQVIDFCLGGARRSERAQWDLVRATSTDAVYRAVERFLQAGSVRPQLWVTAQGTEMVLTRSASDNSVEYARWMNQQQLDEARSSPLLDGVLLGSQLLDAQTNLNEIRLRAPGPDEMFEPMSLMASIHPGGVTQIGSDVDTSPGVCSLTVAASGLHQVHPTERGRSHSLSAALIHFYALRIAWRARPFRRLAAIVVRHVKSCGSRS